MRATKEQIKEIISRMQSAYGVKRSELPKHFFCEAKTINNWIYYCRIPHEQLMRCRVETGKSLDWLMYGTQSSLALTPKLESEISLIIHRAISDAIGYKLLQERNTHDGKLVAEKICKDVFAYFSQATCENFALNK